MKRALDFVFSACGLIILLPVITVVTVMVRLSSAGPAFFRQLRVGRNGRSFILLKFRTMTMQKDAEKGSFDAGSSVRITRVGRVLRKTKLDELPQLWNVLKGDMALVGPRPEIKKWVEAYPDRWERILTVRPGITDSAAIIYRNEEEILARSTNPELTYREEVLPHKLCLYEEYVKNQSFWRDVMILLKTIAVVVRTT